jgi:hypothetical protein
MPHEKLTSELLSKSFSASSLRLLHISAAAPPSAKKQKLDPSRFRSLLAGLHSLVQGSSLPSWTVENDANNASANNASASPAPSPASFLDPSLPQRGYCSWIIQGSSAADMLPSFLKLPLPAQLPTDGQLPLEPSDRDKLTQTEPVWVFVGRFDEPHSDEPHSSSSPPPLVGRPEHTDSVSHDFTWHAQMAGAKTWHIRPTDELLQSCPAAKEHEAGLEVTVRAGDLLLIDTRLWWHRTTMDTAGAAECPLSVSYARDVFVEKQRGVCVPCEPEFTNVDGMYAPHDIGEGEIIFTEKDLPDGEMQRSAKPNCEVVEVEEEEGCGGEESEGEGGNMAVVAIRDIKEGEFLTIADSDDEEGDSDDEGGAEGEDDWENEF